MRGKKSFKRFTTIFRNIMPYLEYHTKTNRMKETGKVHDYYSDFRVRWFRRKNPSIQHRESGS